jgi:ABC-type phosphate transport system substrate-binding protein
MKRSDWSAWRRRTTGRIAAIAALCVLAAVAAAPPASAVTGAPISGAGSTWAENAILDWSASVQSSGTSVNYAGTGSSDGRNEFRNGTVDFAASELPYGLTDNGVTDPLPTRPFSYLPIVAGAVSFPYQLSVGGRKVTNLRLSGLTVAKIFTHAITQWNDPAIQADNPGTTLPAIPVVPVVRGDGAGTTGQLTQWLATQFPTLWDAYCASAGRAPPAGAPPTSPQSPGTSSSHCRRE